MSRPVQLKCIFLYKNNKTISAIVIKYTTGLIFVHQPTKANNEVIYAVVGNKLKMKKIWLNSIKYLLKWTKCYFIYYIWWEILAGRAN